MPSRIRDGWQRALTTPISGVNGERKFLRNCTRADLDVHIERLRNQAEKTRQLAVWYHEIAARMTELDAATVNDLPDDEKPGLLGKIA
jgi:hypothetical protein